MRNLFLLCGLLASSVYGHIQMKTPYPIRSPLNPNGGSNKDYSYTSPLSSSGSDYPCKGYQHDPFVSVATYAPGGSYPMELAGSALHGGGSCQISLSYDTGKSFTVIKSIEGGCPIPEKYTFTIPSDAPIGQALLVWTWFNKIGNREMYMNCAQVTIKGGSSKRNHPRALIHRLRARGSFQSRPPIFLANINGPGQCTTTADDEVNFPLPGPDVEGSVSGKGYTCQGSAPFLGDGSSPGSSSSNSSQNVTVPLVSTPGPLTSTTFSVASTSTFASGTTAPAPSLSISSVIPSSAVVVSPYSVTPSSSMMIPSSPATLSAPSAVIPSPAGSSSPYSGGSGTCTDGQIICSTDGSSFSICDHGQPVSMGQVAPGTQCKDGTITKR